MYHQVIQIDRQVVGLEEGVPTVIDPVTAIGLATTAFNALKKGIAVGKDLQDMGGQLTQWAGAISDLDFADRQNAKPPWYKTLGGLSLIHISEPTRPY